LPDNKHKENQRRAFWFGSIVFGLVSVPVALFPGYRSQQQALRMLAGDGTPLRRRFYCPAEDRPLDKDEIIRGYEIEKDTFVIVKDEELEDLEPEKTKEINLSRFVPIEQIDPVYFDRAYFLVPAGGSRKPYQLLAETMERVKRAGIATFVMRGKEYLIAILAENGILQAETLRFAEEIRTPEDIKIAEPLKAQDSNVEAMVKEIVSATQDALLDEELKDPYADRLLKLISKKKSSGKDVIQAAPESETEEEGKVIDFMEVLKRSMRLTGSRGRSTEKAPVLTAKKSRGETARNLREKSKSDLYEQAKKMSIPGRSSMKKEELIQALLREKSDKKSTRHAHE